MPPIHGRCLCGGVEFEIAGPLMAPLNCHCSQCRKQHGAAFRSRVRVQAKDFRWLKGEHLVKFYESSRGYQRGFCSACGSPIINRNGPNFLEAAGGISQNPRRNTVSRWRCSTIRRCGRRCTASSPARRRGSRSPTICRNIRNIRRCSQLHPPLQGEGRPPQAGGVGCAALPPARDLSTASTPHPPRFARRPPPPGKVENFVAASSLFY